MIGTDPLFGDLRHSKFFGTAAWRKVLDDSRLSPEAKVTWLYCVTKAGSLKRHADVSPEEIEEAVVRNSTLVTAVKNGGARRKPR